MTKPLRNMVLPDSFHAVVVDNSKLDKVPSVVNVGELGTALTNNHNLGSKVAAMPSEPGHIEIAPPAAALNSALATVPWRGSELLLAGMPRPLPSTSVPSER